MYTHTHTHIYMSFPGRSVVKNPPANAGDAGSIPGQNDPLEKERVIHCSILTWEIPWSEDPGRLQSMGSQRVGHDLVTKPPPPLLKAKEVSLCDFLNFP